ncbi:MAG TPA: FliH/SctL family protein [Desulfopila sp.]|nr:FliH/SctL family protein [Desulfopila sp.]
MSKVIRDSTGFIPERMVPSDFDRPAVWENLAKQVEPEPVDVNDLIPEKVKDDAQQSESKKSAPDHATSASSEAQQPSFDNDFSSPEIDDQSLGAQQTTAPAQEPAPQVDVDAIAEEYFNKGLQAGADRVDSDYKLSLKTLQSICEELDTVRETILKNSLSEMQDLVLQIAEKIIRHSVTIQDETIVKTVEEAIQQAVKSDEFIISVNPKDYETIHSRSMDFINAVNGLENVVVRSDASVDQGGCIVESSNCTVDATLASQLEIIAGAVKES